MNNVKHPSIIDLLDERTIVAPLRYTLLQPDGKLLKASILGRGKTGVTFRDGAAALQFPLKYGLLNTHEI